MSEPKVYEGDGEASMVGMKCDGCGKDTAMWLVVDGRNLCGGCVEVTVSPELRFSRKPQASPLPQRESHIVVCPQCAHVFTS